MEGTPSLEIVEAPLEDDRAPHALPIPEALPVLPLARLGRLPGHDHPAGGRPAALDQADRRRPRRRPDAGHGRLARPRTRTPTPADLYDVGVVGVVERMIKVPDGTLADPGPGAQRVRLDDCVTDRPYLIARITELPDEVDAETPSSRR